MPKTLTLSAPKQFSTFYGGRTVTWDLLDEKALDTAFRGLQRPSDSTVEERTVDDA